MSDTQRRGLWFASLYVGSIVVVALIALLLSGALRLLYVQSSRNSHHTRVWEGHCPSMLTWCAAVDALADFV